VRPAGVVLAQERWQPGSALGAVLSGSAVGLFAQAGRDKSLGPALIGVYLREAQAAVVTDGDVGELPTSALDKVAAITGSAVAGALDSSELLGAHVQPGSRHAVLIANDRCSRLQLLPAGRAQLGQPPACGRHTPTRPRWRCGAWTSVAVQLLNAPH